MSRRALVSIGSYDIPAPSTYIGTESTVVDAARNVEGVVIGAIVRESVAKVEMTWKYIDAEKWASIMKLFNTAYGGNFYNNVTFFNQLTNGWTTKEMYVSDRTTEGAFLTSPTTGKITGYLNARLALIEV